MMLVCDTNVLISGFVFPGGLPDKIIRHIISGKWQHATSPDIITEFKRILTVKIKFPSDQIQEVVELITEVSKMVYPIERFNIVKADETDNRILECAATAKADYIITGDKKHLLPLKLYEKIKILSPREFVECVGLV